MKKLITLFVIVALFGCEHKSDRTKQVEILQIKLKEVGEKYKRHLDRQMAWVSSTSEMPQNIKDSMAMVDTSFMRQMRIITSQVDSVSKLK
jgi:hypothetical protein